MRAWVLAVTAVASSAVASPAQEVVVLASSDEAFRTALRDALAPTGMSVIATSDEPPTVAELSFTARQIAEREHATATVWLIFAAGKTTLVTYDRDVDRVLVREVPYRTPLDPTQAAEVARMARTMLRTLRVTPELDLPLPSLQDARVERARATESSPGVRAQRTDRLAVSAGASLRVGAATGEAGFDGRLGVLWRPDAIGVGLDLSVATRADVETMPFSGRVSDDSLALTVHSPVLAGPSVHVLGLAGLAVHAVSLDGMLGSREVAMLRFDPAVRAGVVANYEIGRTFDVGVAMSADILLRRQMYSSGPLEILVVPRTQLTTGLIATFRFL